jgi:hypothetical protein
VLAELGAAAVAALTSVVIRFGRCGQADRAWQPESSVFSRRRLANSRPE